MRTVIEGCLTAKPSVVMQGIKAASMQGYAASASKQLQDSSVVGQIYQVTEAGILLAVSATGYGAVIAGAYLILKEFAKWVVGDSKGGWEAMPELYKVRMMMEFRSTYPPSVEVKDTDRGVEYMRKMAFNARHKIYQDRLIEDPDYGLYPDPRALVDALREGCFPVLENAIPAMVQDRGLKEYAWSWNPFDWNRCEQADIEKIRQEEEKEREEKEARLTAIRMKYKIAVNPRPEGGNLGL